MARSEASLRKGFVDELSENPEIEVTRIEDTLSAGIPDICVTGTPQMWIETKVARGGRVKSKGIQRLTLRRLGRVSPAYMLVWDEERLRVLLIDSKDVPLQGALRVDELKSVTQFHGYSTGFPWHRRVVDTLMRILPLIERPS